MIIPHNTKLLITGAPRSGTYFTTRLLFNLGLDIRHEKNDTHGTVSSLHLINPTGFTKVIHQIREPLKTICSLHKIDWLGKELWLDQKDDENYDIVIGRSAEMKIIDKQTGVILASGNIPYGSKLYVKNGVDVKKGELKKQQWQGTVWITYNMNLPERFYLLKK